MSKKTEQEFNDLHKKKTKSIKRKIFMYLSIFLIIALAIGAYFVFGSFSEGYRAGTVMKMSKKGIFLKTNEGQLNTGGLGGSNGEDIASSIWAFSVDRGDKNVLEEIEKAVDGGYRVKLHYKEKFLQIGFFGDTKYFVKKVEKVGAD